MSVDDRLYTVAFGTATILATNFIKAAAADDAWCTQELEGAVSGF